VQVSSAGKVKVLDFGLARIRELSNKARLTVTGSPMGTPAFMPPEQALAYWDEVDARSDVYSIAASLFTLMTGRLVHDGSTVPEVIVKVSTRPAPPVQSVAPHIPPPIAIVLDRALSFRREGRFDDAGQMLMALRAAVQVCDPASLQRTMSTEIAPVSGAQFDHGLTAGPGLPPPGAKTIPFPRSAVVQTAAPVSARTPSSKTRGLTLGLAAVGALLVLISAIALTLLLIPAPTKKDDPEPPTATPATAHSEAQGSVVAPTDTAGASSPAGGTVVSSSPTAVVAATSSASSKATRTSTATSKTGKPKVVACKKDRYTMRCAPSCTRCD